MGAWGTGSFDDDTHSDFVMNLLEENVSPESFGDYFDNALKLVEEEEFLDYEEGAQVIVCATLLDALLNGTAPDTSIEGLDAWLAEHRSASVANLKGSAVKALEQVIGEESELNELWSENEEDYPEWKANITGLIARLK